MPIDNCRTSAAHSFWKEQRLACYKVVASTNVELGRALTDPLTKPLDVDVEPASHFPQAPPPQPVRTRSSTSKERQHHVRHEIRVVDTRPADRHRSCADHHHFSLPAGKVEGTSMAPLLSDQERIFINKFVYRFEPIHRGDVVVFWYPLDGRNHSSSA